MGHVLSALLDVRLLDPFEGLLAELVDSAHADLRVLNELLERVKLLVEVLVDAVV